VAADDQREHATGLRSAFGAVRRSGGTVVMEFEPTEHDRLEEWVGLRHRWLALSRHPYIIEAIERGEGATLLVRYAALQWSYTSIDLRASPVMRAVTATWGWQLSDAFHAIASAVSADSALRNFLRPLVMIDHANNARMAFLPPAPTDSGMPPEVGTTWPRCDERALVYIAGRAIRDCTTGLDHDDATSIRAIVERCLQPDPTHRYATLEDLRAAWLALAYSVPSNDRLASWRWTEEGLGLLELGQANPALAAFRAALRLNPRSRIARAGRDRALFELGTKYVEVDLSSITEQDLRRGPTRDERRFDWNEAEPRGGAFERAYDYANALGVYLSTRPDGHNNAAIHIAIARCQLALCAAGHAIDYARRALAIEPRNVAALAICTRAHLLARHFADALARADEWVAVVPIEASAHYARGRALFALGRIDDARDAFDRACTLRPQMLEAMLLRREVERKKRGTAATAGVSKPIAIDVPPNLAHLRDALAGGRVAEVIAVLERTEYDDDAAAKLAHAECLAFDRRSEESLELYERAIALSPALLPKAVVGKVHALLALERAAEAFAELDRLSDVEDVDLLELRGLALRRLGLEADAERELGRVVAASHSLSDIRIGRR
jgi:tetratricopeptide (TPR) repeat protein